MYALMDCYQTHVLYIILGTFHCVLCMCLLLLCTHVMILYYYGAMYYCTLYLVVKVYYVKSSYCFKTRIHIRRSKVTVLPYVAA